MKGLCVRGSWRPNKDCNILTPQLFWLLQPFFPVLLGYSAGGLEAQPLLGHGSHSSIFSPTDLNFLSPGLYNNFTSTYFLRASQFVLNSTPRQSRSPPDIFDRMHLLFTQVHFSFDSLAGSEVNMQHFDERNAYIVRFYLHFLSSISMGMYVFMHRRKDVVKANFYAEDKGLEF